jgi:hypothetical protein
VLDTTPASGTDQTFRLDPALKRRLVEALHLNAHRQITTMLSDGSGNVCAMGLLYELAKASPVESYLDMNQRLGLPVVSAELGMLSVGEIIHLNDTGHSFHEIADRIEQEW